jgi:serine/threonine-protein kinase
MEYVDGEDLAHLLPRIGRFSTERSTELARQLCLGLHAAHEKGVLHRDLKPANVMIDGRGKLLITDFGLAAVASEIRDEDIRSGTPAYMAPEQLAGREVTERSDIYSLGILLHEIYTGKPAWQAKTMAELHAQRQSSPTPWFV